MDGRMGQALELTAEEIQRYSRHLCLAGVGEEGQRRIRSARALVVGVGGLGSPIALYLAAAGVGVLGLVDPDVVELSNLQRQIAHGTGNLGARKVESAARRIGDLNPGVRVEAMAVKLGRDNAAELVAGYDVIVDALDSLRDRFLLSDACVAAGKPMVHGAVSGWMGEAMTYAPGRGPCYRCVFGGGAPAVATGDAAARDGTAGDADGAAAMGVCAGLEDAPEDLGPLAPERVGVLSSAPGVIGAIEATEVLKLVTGVGEPLVGRLLLWDGMRMKFDQVEVMADPVCSACGGR
ncbi:MAG: HesA/MoeB/ThiF family protein [Firmicutes bacterium]|nr:HesA/MoeB/ThiF family protein [Bacillota bacterium]